MSIAPPMADLSPPATKAVPTANTTTGNSAAAGSTIATVAASQPVVASPILSAAVAPSSTPSRVPSASLQRPEPSISTQQSQQRVARQSSKITSPTQSPPAAAPRPLGLNRQTSLQHLNHGVPVQYHRKSSQNTPAVSRTGSMIGDGVPLIPENSVPTVSIPENSVADPFNEEFNEMDIMHAAKAAAEHAFALWCERESNWEENRTSEIPVAMLDEIRILDFSTEKTLSPASLLHHLPADEKRALIHGVHDLEKVRKKERDELEKQRFEERLREKLKRKEAREAAAKQAALEQEEAQRKAEREKRKQRKTGGKGGRENSVSRSTGGGVNEEGDLSQLVFKEQITTQSMINDILSTLPADATTCSQCQPKSPCHLLTLPSYTYPLPLHPSSLTSFHFTILARNPTSNTLAVKLDSNAPNHVFFATNSVFYVYANSSHLIEIDYVGEFMEQCSRLNPEDGPSLSPHTITVSTKIMQRADIANGFGSIHPGLFWDYGADTHETHSFPVQLQWIKGDGKQNNVPGVNEFVYQSIKEKLLGEPPLAAKTPSPQPKGVQFDPDTKDSDGLPTTSSTSPIPRTKRKRSEKCRTMVSLSEMREAIGKELKPSAALASLPSDSESEHSRRSGRLSRSCSRAGAGGYHSGNESRQSHHSRQPSGTTPSYSVQMYQQIESDIQKKLRSDGWKPASEVERPYVDQSEQTTQTQLSWLRIAGGPVDIASLGVKALEDAAEEAKYNAEEYPDDDAAAEIDKQLQGLLQEWESCIRNAEQRRRQESERIASMRVHQAAGSMPPGTSSPNTPGSRGPTTQAPTTVFEGTPMSAQLFASQKLYLRAELSALDHERDTLMCLEMDVNKQAMLCGKRVFDDDLRSPNELTRKIPGNDRWFERRHARLRERVIRIEAVRAQHRILLQEEMERVRLQQQNGVVSPPSSVLPLNALSHQPKSPISPQQSFFSQAELRRVITLGSPTAAGGRPPKQQSAATSEYLDRLASIYGSPNTTGHFVALKLPKLHQRGTLPNPSTSSQTPTNKNPLKSRSPLVRTPSTQSPPKRTQSLAALHGSPTAAERTLTLQRSATNLSPAKSTVPPAKTAFVEKKSTSPVRIVETTPAPVPDDLQRPLTAEYEEDFA